MPVVGGEAIKEAGGEGNTKYEENRDVETERELEY